MAVEVARTDMTGAEVKAAVMRLGLLRESIEGAYAKYVELVSDLYAGRAWIVDGAGSWEAFVEKHDVRVKLPRAERKEVSAALLEGGLPTRAAAAALSVSNKTIHQDAEHVLPPGNTSLASRIDSIGREQPSTKPPADLAVPRRSSLPKAYNTAVSDLWRSIERLNRLSSDDRFTPNREQLRNDNETRLFELAGQVGDVWAILVGAPTRNDLEVRRGGAVDGTN